MAENILEVKNLKKHFNTGKGLLHAVDGVNFEIKKGETLGLVVDLPHPDSPTRPNVSPRFI